jgi:hypothetical protein
MILTRFANDGIAYRITPGKCSIMKTPLNLILMLAAIVAAIVVSGQPSFARGGGPANIINSPGYQRRLEESRQSLTPPSVGAAQTGHRQPRRNRQRH